MYMDNILATLKVESPRLHTPLFRVEAEEGGRWRVFDNDRALALFHPDFLDIWALSPFEPDEIANPEPLGLVVDLHTVHNTYLNFGAQGWPDHWSGVDLRWDWRKQEGAELIVDVSLAARDGESARWHITIGYAPDRGCYTYKVVLDARKLDPDGFEFFNLMTAGALEDRPEKRRWTHSLWENPNGELRRIVHSNALFECTDYSNLRKKDGPWRRRNLPYPRAWMAYAAHPTFNPAILIHETTVPLQGATCSMLFDEHLLFSEAGQDNLGRDGYFHFHLEFEFVNLPMDLAARLLAKAADPVRPDVWRDERVALPFLMDTVNSFETELDPWQPEECPILVVQRNGDGQIAWVDDEAHSGNRSICMRQMEKGLLRLFPEGAVCKVEPNQTYRFHGFVKTAAVEGTVRLELAGYAYTYTNISHQDASIELNGDKDWTRLEVRLNSERQAYLMPSLVLDGPGMAWFDDIEFAPV